jgi:hypothetical protein
MNLEIHTQIDDDKKNVCSVVNGRRTFAQALCYHLYIAAGD